MRNHIILGRHRSIHKKHIGHALHTHKHSHNKKHGHGIMPIGHGTAAVKKNYSGMGEGTKHKGKHFKPLKFKL